jgi:hypothetical protein
MNTITTHVLTRPRASGAPPEKHCLPRPLIRVPAAAALPVIVPADAGAAGVVVVPGPPRPARWTVEPHLLRP